MLVQQINTNTNIITNMKIIPLLGAGAQLAGEGLARTDTLCNVVEDRLAAAHEFYTTANS